MHGRLGVLQARFQASDLDSVGVYLIFGQRQLRLSGLQRPVRVKRSGLGTLYLPFQVCDHSVPFLHLIGGVFQLRHLRMHGRLRILQFGFQTDDTDIPRFQLLTYHIQFRGCRLLAALSVLSRAVTGLQGGLHTGDFGVFLRQAIPGEFQLGIARMNSGLRCLQFGRNRGDLSISVFQLLLGDIEQR